MSGTDGMLSFIQDTQRDLTSERRLSLVSYLSAAQFSSVKHEIMTSDDDDLIKALLVGLLFGQIDAYAFNQRSIKEGYLNEFDQVCLRLDLPKTFIAPITLGADEICELFG
ncbi:MAG: hypothetical protein V7745_00575 [Pseudomonadales bacterium]